MMKIIALTGKAGVGKDTFAKKLRETFPSKVFVVAYADLLKNICSRNFYYKGIKNNRDRRILQTIGDIFRANDSEFFIKPVVNMLPVADEMGFQYFVITDVRFENEVVNLMNKGYPVEVIKLVRDFESKLDDVTSTHRTEQGLPSRFITRIIHLPNDINYKFIYKEVLNE